MHCPCRLEATRFVDPLSNQVCWLHNSSFVSEHVHACNAGEVVGPNDGFITKFVRQRLEGEKLSRTRALCKDRPVCSYLPAFIILTYAKVVWCSICMTYRIMCMK